MYTNRICVQYSTAKGNLTRAQSIPYPRPHGQDNIWYGIDSIYQSRYGLHLEMVVSVSGV